MPEHILVTGAAGFLGSHICQYLGQRGHHITGIDKFSPPFPSSDIYANLKRYYEIDLPDDAFTGILKEFQPNLLIHCAGSASVPYSMQEPYDDFQQSSRLTAFILDTMRKHLPSCYFVFLSSAAVYGNPVKLPIDEGATCQPISPYGYHKYICEMLCREYESIYGIKNAVLRIFSAYGERLRKQILYDLCKKFTDKTSNTVELYGTGNETRDFIHASDIARAIECVYDARASGIFNVASGKQIRIGEVADMVKSCFESMKNIIYNGSSKPGDPLHWEADISRLTSLGFRQQIPFDEGTRKYCHWFKAEYDR